MTKAVARDPIYRQRRFPTEIIELCVRWYITYRLSYRDLVAMMAEQGIAVSHTTILRWVLRDVPVSTQRIVSRRTSLLVHQPPMHQNSPAGRQSAQFLEPGLAIGRSSPYDTRENFLQEAAYIYSFHREGVGTGATTTVSTGNKRHWHWAFTLTSRWRRRELAIGRLGFCSRPARTRRFGGGNCGQVRLAISARDPLWLRCGRVTNAWHQASPRLLLVG